MKDAKESSDESSAVFELDDQQFESFRRDGFESLPASHDEARPKAKPAKGNGKGKDRTRKTGKGRANPANEDECCSMLDASELALLSRMQAEGLLKVHVTDDVDDGADDDGSKGKGKGKGKGGVMKGKVTKGDGTVYSVAEWFRWLDDFADQLEAEGQDVPSRSSHD